MMQRSVVPPYAGEVARPERREWPEKAPASKRLFLLARALVTNPDILADSCVSTYGTSRGTAFSRYDVKSAADWSAAYQILTRYGTVLTVRVALQIKEAKTSSLSEAIRPRSLAHLKSQVPLVLSCDLQNPCTQPLGPAMLRRSWKRSICFGFNEHTVNRRLTNASTTASRGSSMPWPQSASASFQIRNMLRAVGTAELN